MSNSDCKKKENIYRQFIFTQCKRILNYVKIIFLIIFLINFFSITLFTYKSKLYKRKKMRLPCDHTPYYFS